MTINIAVQFIADTADTIFAKGLQVAKALGLPVTSWRTGDPTQSDYRFLSEVFAAREEQLVEYLKSGFKSTATGDWLRQLVAPDVYGIDPVEATFAEPTVTIRNNGGGRFEIGPGDLTVKATVSGKTYHSTDDGGGPLTAGVTRTYALVADEAGSDSTVIANDIDALVTTLLRCEILSSTAAIGLDEQDEEEIKSQCDDTLGALSPDGPADAYQSVCRNSKLTGVLDITRASAIDDSTTGLVTVFVAGASGPVAGASLIAAQAAVETWAKPRCIRATVAHATAVPVAVTATVTADAGDLPGDFATTLATTLAQLLRRQAIAKADGYSIDLTTFTTAMRNAVPQITAIALSIPAAAPAFTVGQYPIAGAFTLTEA